MPKYELRRNFMDGTNLFLAGSIVDLPEKIAPKSAINLDKLAAEAAKTEDEDGTAEVDLFAPDPTEE